MAIGQYSWCAAPRPSDLQESSPWGGFPGRSEGESLQGPVEVLLVIWLKKKEKHTVLLWRKGRSDDQAITPGPGTSSWSRFNHMRLCDLWVPVGPVQRVFGSAKSMFVTVLAHSWPPVVQFGGIWSTGGYPTLRYMFSCFIFHSSLFGHTDTFQWQCSEDSQ